MFDILMVFLKKIEKVDFKKNPEDDKKHAKFSSGQRVVKMESDTCNIRLCIVLPTNSTNLSLILSNLVHWKSL